jgi:lipopolysaccharide transport system permease protein
MSEPSLPPSLPGPPPAASPGERPELLIEPGRAAAHYWRDLWAFRELLFFLGWRDIAVRYKQAALGAAWAVVQPLVTMVVGTFLFSTIAHMSSGNVPYPMLVLAGLLPWQLFSSALSGASGSLVSNTNLISKIYFPRMVVPLSSLGVAIADFLVTLVLYVAFAVGYGVWPTWHILVLPLFILIAMAIALGSGLWLCALTVKYRDFRFLVPFMLQFGIFATPVLYRTDNLHEWSRTLLKFNPLTGVIAGFRWSLLGTAFALDPPELAISILGAAILLASGAWYFRKTERLFADII